MVKHERLLTALLSAALISPSLLSPITALSQEPSVNPVSDISGETPQVISKKIVRDYTQGVLSIAFEDSGGKRLPFSEPVKAIGNWANTEGELEADENLKQNSKEILYFSLKDLYSNEEGKNHLNLSKAFLLESEDKKEIEPYLFIGQDNTVRYFFKGDIKNLGSVTDDLVLEKAYPANDTEIIIQLQEAAPAAFLEVFEQAALDAINKIEGNQQENQDSGFEPGQQEISDTLLLKWPLSNKDKEPEELIAYKEITLSSIKEITIPKGLSMFIKEADYKDHLGGIDYIAEIESFDPDQDVNQFPETLLAVLEDDSEYWIHVLQWNRISDESTPFWIYQAITEEELNYADHPDGFLIAIIDPGVGSLQYPISTLASADDDYTEAEVTNNQSWALAFKIDIEGKEYVVAQENMGSSYSEHPELGKNERKDILTNGITIYREELPAGISVSTFEEAQEFAGQLQKSALYKFMATNINKDPWWIQDWVRLEIAENGVEILESGGDEKGNPYKFEITTVRSWNEINKYRIRIIDKEADTDSSGEDNSQGNNGQTENGNDDQNGSDQNNLTDLGLSHQLWAWALDNGDGTIRAVGETKSQGVTENKTGYLPVSIAELDLSEEIKNLPLHSLSEEQIKLVNQALEDKFKELGINVWHSNDESKVRKGGFTFFDVDSFAYRSDKNTENGLVFEVLSSIGGYKISWEDRTGKNEDTYKVCWDNTGKEGNARFYVEIVNEPVPEEYLLEKPVYKDEYKEILGYRIHINDPEKERTVIYGPGALHENNIANPSMASLSDYNPDYFFSGVQISWEDIGLPPVFTEEDAASLAEILTGKIGYIQVLNNKETDEGEWSKPITYEKLEYVSGSLSEKGYPVYKFINTSHNATWQDPKYWNVDFYVSISPRRDLTAVDQASNAADVEKEYIVTENSKNPVVNPSNTTVDFFDYWLTNQTDNDYEVLPKDENIWDLEEESKREKTNHPNAHKILEGAINLNHLFLFAGGWYFNEASNGDAHARYYGPWNTWTGSDESEGSIGLQARSGIVKNLLDPDGYPVLDIGEEYKETVNNPKDYIRKWGLVPNQNDWGKNAFALSGLWLKTLLAMPEYREESLAYLFNPDFPEGKSQNEQDGRATYKNVQGLFRKNEKNYYYFNSDETFAELNTESSFIGDKKKSQSEVNKVTLYSEPWRLKNSNGYFGGQFFPYNDWSQLFGVENNSSKVYQLNQDSTVSGGNRSALKALKDTDNHINHYFGMTVTTEFEQPLNGTITSGSGNDEHSVFEFAGDDDVWIFIDGVLVGDVGGIHDAVSVKIDFATGEIVYEKKASELENKVYRVDSLYSMFEAANAENSVSWTRNLDRKGYTFANGSVHVLKFFYLERGNDVSNCFISFNMPEPNEDKIRKVDEDGNILDSALFDLYVASPKEGVYQEDRLYHLAKEFEIVTGADESPLISSISYSGEYYNLVDENGRVIGFSDYFRKNEKNPDGSEIDKDNFYFILKETNTPKGYRTNKDIVLRYQQSTDTLTVVNKYETGAYASFAAGWENFTNNIKYATFDPETGTVTRNGGIVNQNQDRFKEGLTLIVPVQKTGTGSRKSKWVPLVGSNTYGWNPIGLEEDPNKNIVEILTAAALLQIADDQVNIQDWYMRWVDKGDQGELQGTFENLPGDPTRYLRNNETGDLNLIALFIPEESLSVLGLQGEFKSDDDRVSELKSVLSQQISNGSLEEAYTVAARLFTQTGPSVIFLPDLKPTYTTTLFIPNERRELRVRKVDQDGKPVEGAIFAIFNTPQDIKDWKEWLSNSDHDAEQKEEIPADIGPEDILMKKLRKYQKDHPDKLKSFAMTSDLTPENENPAQDKGIQYGMAVFRQTTLKEENDGSITPENGYGDIIWPSSRTDESGDVISEEDSLLWMIEVYAPAGFALNENLVRIEAGDAAIYANATGYDSEGNLLTAESRKNDGIKVHGYLGKLSQTLVKYAIGNGVDSTLQDITIYKQYQDINEDKKGALGNADQWDYAKPSANEGEVEGSVSYDLHYGLNSDQLTGQYGLHEKDENGEVIVPAFTVNDGYVRAMPKQNPSLCKYDQYSSTATKNILSFTGQEDLMELDGLFSLLNVVEVTDSKAAAFKVAKQAFDEDGGPYPKMVKNEDGQMEYQYAGPFQFELTILEADGTPLKDPENSEKDLTFHAYIHPIDHQIGDSSGLRDCTENDHLHSGDDCQSDLILSSDTNKFIFEIKEGEEIVITGLPYGAYYSITELDSLDNWDTTISEGGMMPLNIEASQKTKEGYINDQNGDGSHRYTELTFTNIKRLKLQGGELPETGGSGSIAILILGGFITFIGMGVTVLLLSRRRYF